MLTKQTYTIPSTYFTRFTWHKIQRCSLERTYPPAILHVFIQLLTFEYYSSWISQDTTLLFCTVATHFRNQWCILEEITQWNNLKIYSNNEDSERISPMFDLLYHKNTACIKKTEFSILQLRNVTTTFCLSLKYYKLFLGIHTQQKPIFTWAWTGKI